MNKITLDTFIQKYNLGGNVNSVKWVSNGDSLSTRFISPDKSLLGELTLSKQNLPNFENGKAGGVIIFYHVQMVDTFK